MPTTHNLHRKNYYVAAAGILWTVLAIATLISAYRTHLLTLDKQTTEQAGELQQKKDADLKDQQDKAMQMTNQARRDLEEALGRDGAKIAYDIDDSKRPVASHVTFEKSVSLTDADLTNLRQLPPCVELDLTRATVTDAQLGLISQLTHLQKVNLGGNKVENVGFAKLKQLPKLTSVDITGTLLTKDGVKDFTDARPQTVLEGKPGRAEESAAIKIIEDFGGYQRQEPTLPGNPVVEVDLSGAPVTDRDLASLKDLSSLRLLSLSRTAVSDDGLENLAGLESLEALDLSGTEITDEGLTHLKRLIHLKFLWLGVGASQADYRFLDDRTKGVWDMEAAQRRWPTPVAPVKANVTDKGVANLKPLKYLQLLDLTGCNISDGGLRQIGKLQDLTRLNLSRTGVTRVKELAGLTNLTSLSLNDAPGFTGLDLERLKGLEKLDELDLSGDVLIAFPPPPAPAPPAQAPPSVADKLALLAHLQRLDLNGVGTAQPINWLLEKLPGLSNLQELHLARNTQVNDASLVPLQHMNTLFVLDLTNTGVTGGTSPPNMPLIPIKLPPNLTELRLDGCVLNAAGLPSLTTTSLSDKLKTLSLRRCFTGPAALDLSKVPYLEALDLSENQFSDEVIPTVESLGRLKELDLHDLPVTAKVLALKLPQLKSLDAHGSNVGKPSPDLQVAFTHLTSLKLGGSLRNEDLAFLNKFPELENLDLSALSLISNDGLKHLAGLRSLTALKLAGRGIGDDGMESLSKLGRLSELGRLKILSLENTAVTESGVAALAPRHAETLLTLNLHLSEFGAKGEKPLEQFTKLRALFLGTENLNRAALNQLNGLKRLRTLDLTGSNPHKLLESDWTKLSNALPGLAIERK